MTEWLALLWIEGNSIKAEVIGIAGGKKREALLAFKGKLVDTLITDDKAVEKI